MRTVINFFDHLCFNFVSNTSVWIWLEVSLSVVNKWTVIIQMCWLRSCLCLRLIVLCVELWASFSLLFLVTCISFPWSKCECVRSAEVVYCTPVASYILSVVHLYLFHLYLLFQPYVLCFIHTLLIIVSDIFIVSFIHIVVHSYSFNHTYSDSHTYRFIHPYILWFTHTLSIILIVSDILIVSSIHIVVHPCSFNHTYTVL